MSKVAIYCRLSDEDRNKLNSLDESESIQNQKSLLNKYAVEKGWDVYNIYCDDDYSGLDQDRPQWNKMLEDARTGKFDIILCKSQSRFTRDMELVEKYLHNKFCEWGIRFIGLTDNSDTSDKGNKKQRQIMGLTNEWYCEDVSENIRAVLDSKRKEGKFIGAFAAYGYVKDEKDKNRLIIDDEAAEVVRTIYNLYLEGYGTRYIAGMLNDKHIPNPALYKQLQGYKFINSNIRNGSNLWNRTTVKRILRNEIYIGNMVQGKRKKVSYKSAKIVSTSKDQWIRAENTHEPVIDRNIYYEVQRRMNSKQRSEKKGQTHLFSGIVRCLNCGSTMDKVTTFRNGKRYLSYLRCKKYSTAGEKLCSSHSVRLDILQEKIAERLSEYIKHYMDESIILLKLQKESSIPVKVSKLKRAISAADKEISLINQAVKNLYLDKTRGIIKDEQFDELNKGFLKERDSLVRIKKLNEDEICDLNERISNCNYVEIINSFKNIRELSHTIVNEFIELIEIGEKDITTGEQNIIIHWKF